MFQNFAYMLKPKVQTQITEAAVVSPPALWIIDNNGDVFTHGMEYGPGPHGHFAFNVMRNGTPTGDFASHIERRNGKVRIFTATGWKIWNGRSFI